MKPWGQKRGRVFLSRLNATKFISLHRPFYLFFANENASSLTERRVFYCVLRKTRPILILTSIFLFLFSRLSYSRKILFICRRRLPIFFDTIATVKHIRRTRRDLRPRTPGVQHAPFSAPIGTAASFDATLSYFPLAQGFSDEMSQMPTRKHAQKR